ncbi:MAG: FtsX-like permease family protein, partial [Oscillospiraceae bacterium]
VIIGISSVTLILALGQGGKAKMMSQLEAIGTNSVSISVNSSNTQNLITDKDISVLKEKNKFIKYASASETTMATVTLNKNNEKKAVISLGNSDLLKIASTEFLQGRNFNDEEYETAKNVIIIDELAANNIFGTIDCVGQSVSLSIKGKNITMTIIGVAKSLTASFEMPDMPYIFYAPSKTINNAMGKDPTYKSIMISAIDENETETMGNTACAILENRHGVRGDNVYKAEMMIAQVDQINSVIDIFTTVMMLVAAISLLVGGIGVMNIMLVSVTERTREIGIRKALGAKTKSILTQFLTESAIITIVGGIIGLILGISCGYLIGSFVGFEPVFSIVTVSLAILFSAFVGIFFGIYPAKKAAKMNPIDALRFLE